MGIDVTAFGLPISRGKEKGKGNEERNPLEKKRGVGYFLTSIEQVGQKQ